MRLAVKSTCAKVPGFQDLVPKVHENFSENTTSKLHFEYENQISLLRRYHNALVAIDFVLYVLSESMAVSMYHN